MAMDHQTQNYYALDYIDIDNKDNVLKGLSPFVRFPRYTIAS